MSTMSISEEVDNTKAPNGYGSVVKLSGNRRRPFAARKTVGWNDKGQPTYKTIGYYATRQEAMISLAEYNRNPYDIDLAKITMKELFERWSKRDFPKMSKSSASSHKSAFKHAEHLHNMPYKQIKAYMMQEVIDECGCGYSTQGAIKNLFGQLDRYALELDIITKCNSSLIHAAPIPPSSKVPFTEEEINKVWAVADEPYADTILILLYTGFRISELLSLETAKINLEDNYFQGGTKTKAGKDRIVPIHPRILDMVKARMEEGNKYLITWNGHKMTATQYYTVWGSFMRKLGMNHTPHECRHTFRSRLDSAGANKVCIDLMMGHKSKEVGERIYTHKSIQELARSLALVT